MSWNITWLPIFLCYLPPSGLKRRITLSIFSVTLQTSMGDRYVFSLLCFSSDSICKSEAQARIIVDPILIQVCLFLKHRLFCMPHILLELTVGRFTYKPAIIENKNEKKALGLTDHLDYALLFALLLPADLVKSLGIMELQVREGRQSSSNLLFLASHHCWTRTRGHSLPNKPWLGKYLGSLRS